jgi:hypothetical protein
VAASLLPVVVAVWGWVELGTLINGENIVLK